MSAREGLLTLAGCAVGALGTYLAVSWPSGRVDATPAERALASGKAEHGAPGGDAGASLDPAMVANANLVLSLQECSRKLSRLADDESRTEQELSAERMEEADASRSAQARRFSRRDPSQSDWQRMASVGTIRYRLPCSTFNPTPEALAGLGLSPRDVPAVQSAFTGARDTAWAQIRPLCAAAVGSPTTADTLGLDACPQVILEAERTTNPAAAEGAMRAVGAVKAGLAAPSSIPADDPVAATFLALTGVAKDAESRLGAVMGPEDARTALYGSGSCGRTSEFGSAGVASATR